MRGIHWTPAAEEDLQAATEWLVENRPGREQAFGAEVRAAVKRAREHAEHGSPHLWGTRRFVLSKFRYDLIYLVRTEFVWIVAVAHHSREPGYWRERLRDIH